MIRDTCYSGKHNSFICEKALHRIENIHQRQRERDVVDETDTVLYVQFIYHQNGAFMAARLAPHTTQHNTVQQKKAI